MPSKLFFWKRKNKKEEEDSEKNPFTEKSEKKKPDPTSFGQFVKGTVKDFGYKTTKTFEGVSGKRFHIRILRKTKRVLATLFLFFYLALGMVSLSSAACLLFFATAFLMFDYVWKTRKIVDWVKPT